MDDRLKDQILREAGHKVRYKEGSKERLKKFTSQKITTTMIGALDLIEKHFGFLFQSKNMSKEHVAMLAVYKELRKELLDLGNGQKRALESEMDNYSITWEKYHLSIPIIKKGQENE